jgi:hypothetical protein
VFGVRVPAADFRRAGTGAHSGIAGASSGVSLAVCILTRVERPGATPVDADLGRVPSG